MRILKKFQFKHEYWSDDWEDYSHNRFGDAFYPHHAAENIAEYLWSEESYGSPEDSCETILIKSDDGTIQSFNVSGSTTIHWNASETTPKKVLT